MEHNYSHHDALNFLNTSAPLKEKLVSAHQAVQKSHPFVARVAIALYSQDTKVLSTYMHSSGEDNPLDHYQTVIENAPSLKKILELGKPRVINNMLTFEDDNKKHIRRLGRQGYAASYTMPMFNNGEFFGFLFFNSYEKEVFNERTLEALDLHGHIIALMLVNEMSSIQTLTAAIKTTGHITHQRDPETGSHLDRMSRYSRLIAQVLAEQYNLDDSYIEHIFMFSPLHDIGKIAIPDSILLKQGKLNDDEMSIMKTHVHKGKEMIDTLINNFALNSISQTDMLSNIALCHHEAINGSGYPEGISGNKIPLEARIVAVADIFDALTSRRPYKEAWSNEKAFEALHEMAGEKLDTDCVDALFSHQQEIEEIQLMFKEQFTG